MSLGIYVQFPFCRTKCTYCNFHTGVVSSSRYEPYVRAVSLEIREYAARLSAAGIVLPDGFSGFAVDTVYFGGGTPSLLDPPLLQSLLDAIRAAFSCSFREVTLEADPETIELSKAAAWLAAGINRVSLGTQSFFDVELRAAGRLHRRQDIYNAVRILRSAGFRNISFDLIAGLPHQTRDSWQDSLLELGRLAPEHASIYLLEIDEGSRLGAEILRGGERYSALEVPSDELMADCYDLARTALADAGYLHYEISNFAKPGFSSLHNRKYWRRQPYLGFGAGAHSFSGKQRWANAHDPAAYVRAVTAGCLPVEHLETISGAQALEEELFLGLRQLEGIDVVRLQNIYGVALEPRFAPLESSGLIERCENVVRLAPEHLSVSNEVLVELLR